MTVSLRSIILTVSDLQEAVSNKSGSELNRLAHRQQKVRQPIVLWAAALFFCSVRKYRVRQLIALHPILIIESAKPVSLRLLCCKPVSV